MCLTYTDLDRTDQVSHMSTDYYTDHIDHTSQLDHIDHIDRRYVINDHTCYQDTDFDHTDQVCHMFTDHIDLTIQTCRTDRSYRSSMSCPWTDLDHTDQNGHFYTDYTEYIDQIILSRSYRL